MATDTTRVSTAGYDLIHAASRGIRVSTVGYELIHAGESAVPIFQNDPGQKLWKLYHFAVKVRREERP